MGILIHTGGLVQEANPPNGEAFKLEECQEMVGGFIEIVRLNGSKLIMVINEEGKLSDLEPNSVATIMARAHNAIYPNDYIAGDVLICKMNEVR